MLLLSPLHLLVLLFSWTCCWSIGNRASKQAGEQAGRTVVLLIVISLSLSFSHPYSLALPIYYLSFIQSELECVCAHKWGSGRECVCEGTCCLACAFIIYVNKLTWKQNCRLNKAVYIRVFVSMCMRPFIVAVVVVVVHVLIWCTSIWYLHICVCAGFFSILILLRILCKEYRVTSCFLCDEDAFPSCMTY